MSALLEVEGVTDDEDSERMITGSEMAIAGSIPRKTGDKRFTCLGNDNEYFELVKLTMPQSDAEEGSKGNNEKTHLHNGLCIYTMGL